MIQAIPVNSRKLAENNAALRTAAVWCLWRESDHLESSTSPTHATLNPYPASLALRPAANWQRARIAQAGISQQTHNTRPRPAGQ
eukprot:364970-Chlamydomonas_euryale.AAC.5